MVICDDEIVYEWVCTHAQMYACHVVYFNRTAKAWLLQITIHATCMETKLASKFLKILK